MREGKIHYEASGGYYLCNRALGSAVKRKTKDVMQVTCLNCNRELARGKPKNIFGYLGIGDKFKELQILNFARKSNPHIKKR